MKTFSQTDCDFFLEVLDTVKKEGSFTSQNMKYSAKARQKMFWALRAALRNNEFIEVPWGYPSVLSSYIPFMDKIVTSVKDNTFTAKLKGQ